MIVEGQIHGSIAQGLGQAMMENAVFDSSGGQLVTGSFMDYAMPRADDMPLVQGRASTAVPATTNPLGVKGAGEAGTTAAIAAVMNAIADAIPGGAGAHLDMPATPEKVWQACREGGAGVTSPLPAWSGNPSFSVRGMDARVEARASTAAVTRVTPAR